MHFDHVPGGAGGLRHDGGVAARQQVQQARLAGVGRPDDGDQKARAKPFAAAVVLKVGGDFTDQLADLLRRRRFDAAGQVLIGKIDAGFNVGEGLEQPFAPGFIKLSELPLKLPQGLVALGRGFGLDQVGQPFGGGQIHLAVLEGAAGKLARFRHPQPSHGA